MFTSEQYYQSKTKKGLKKAGFRIGMAFVKPTHVKRRFTYKEFSLIAGILVALIIVFTLWLRQEPHEQSSNGLKKKPALSLPEVAKSFVKKTLAQIRF